MTVTKKITIELNGDEAEALKDLVKSCLNIDPNHLNPNDGGTMTVSHTAYVKIKQALKKIPVDLLDL